MKKIINTCHKEVKELLISKRDSIDALAKRLLESEVITLPDLIDVLGPRPYPMKESMREYLDELEKRMSEKKNNPKEVPL